MGYPRIQFDPPITEPERAIVRDFVDWLDRQPKRIYGHADKLRSEMYRAAQGFPKGSFPLRTDKQLNAMIRHRREELERQQCELDFSANTPTTNGSIAEVQILLSHLLRAMRIDPEKVLAGAKDCSLEESS